MAYPESVPNLTASEARHFSKRLKGFRLSKELKEFYEDAEKEAKKSFKSA